MRFDGLSRSGALALAAVLLAAAPAAAQRTSETRDAHTEKCTETLEKNYGAKAIDNLSSNRGTRNPSIYADITLGDGSTIRVRCRFDGDNVGEVQVYAPPAMGSGLSGNQWGPADQYRVETPPEPEKTEPEKAETPPPDDKETPPPDGQETPPPDDKTTPPPEAEKPLPPGTKVAPKPAG